MGVLAGAGRQRLWGWGKAGSLWILCPWLPGDILLKLLSSEHGVYFSTLTYKFGLLPKPGLSSRTTPSMSLWHSSANPKLDSPLPFTPTPLPASLPSQWHCHLLGFSSPNTPSCPTLPTLPTTDTKSFFILCSDFPSPPFLPPCLYLSSHTWAMAIAIH